MIQPRFTRGLWYYGDMDYREIEVRFLGIDKDALIKKLLALGAEDKGEQLLDEQIIYDKALTWQSAGKTILKLRTINGHTTLAYKHRVHGGVDGTEEIEFSVSDARAAELLLDRLGFVSFREQQKRRHTFVLDGVTLDIDMWPGVPPYVELEGMSEDDLRAVAQKIDLSWDNVELRNPRHVLEEVYHIPVGNLRYFTFDRVE